MKETKTCKYCGEEINKKAKVCPHCRKKQSNKFLRLLAVILGIIIIIAGCNSLFKDTSNAENDTKQYATLEKYNSIENGMTYSEVVELIGFEGTSMSETEYAGQTAKIYYWYAENGISNITAYFTNDKLVSKSQIGLE